MIYIKRITSADVTRQIDLTKDSAESFFGFDYTAQSEISLKFIEEGKQNVVYGTLKKSGHTPTIVGNLFSVVKESCEQGDLIIFKSTSSQYTYTFRIISQGDSDYNGFDNALNLFGSRSSVIQQSTHLIASLDDYPLLGNDNKGETILTTRQFASAIKTKPFILLAGLSGTGKSRIVRELARACWEQDDAEYKAQKPRNFEMVQVKPNWHDSSELIGYVSRVSGEPKYVVGKFLKFVAQAWLEPTIPYFLCLDEMNLAPVEQYFAEYLSVIETRKYDEDDKVIKTDAILFERTDNSYSTPNKWYKNLVCELVDENHTKLRDQFLKDGICIPQNLIVVGTVNMDETTFSFSRKVLDRAMTIEMNEVNLNGGLTEKHENIGLLTKEELIGSAVEGVDVYGTYKDVCDTVIEYLKKVNNELEGSPFKIAYRTRNEFLLYVVNNLPYNKRKTGQDLEQNYVIARALDEITSMKILSRIEGDETKVTVLGGLKKAIAEGLNEVSGLEYADAAEAGKELSVSLAKLKEMEKRLQTGYTSFWS